MIRSVAQDGSGTGRELSASAQVREAYFRL